MTKGKCIVRFNISDTISLYIFAVRFFYFIHKPYHTYRLSLNYSQQAFPVFLSLPRLDTTEDFYQIAKVEKGLCIYCLYVRKLKLSIAFFHKHPKLRLLLRLNDYSRTSYLQCQDR